MEENDRKHNKSGSNQLSLLDNSDTDILFWAEKIILDRVEVVGLIQGSPCTQIKAKDGRFTYQRIKVGFAYQIIAFKKYGRESLLNVPTVKSRDSLVISHLCGTRNCCSEDHIYLESKEINDERVHCHFCILNAYKIGGWDNVNLFFSSGGCPHIPRCCTIYILYK